MTDAGRIPIASRCGSAANDAPSATPAARVGLALRVAAK